MCPSRRRARRWRAAINLVCADRVGESIMPNLTVRENLFLNPLAAGLSLFSFISPGRENRAARGARRRRWDCGQTIRRSPIELLVRAATSRRWWSGAGCTSNAKIYVFEDPTAGVDVGAKAEIYRSVRRRAPGRGGDRHRVDRFRGGGEGLPPRAGVRSRPGGRRAGRRGSVGREPARRGFGEHRSVGAARLAASSHGRGGAMQSIKSNALEPTPSELARAVARAGDRPTRAGLWPAAPDAGVDRLLLDPAARHVPDLAQRAVDPRGQGDHRAARRSPRPCR